MNCKFKKIFLTLFIGALFIIGSNKAYADTFGSELVCTDRVADQDIIKCQLRLYGSNNDIKEISGSFYSNDNFILDHFERSSYVTSGTEENSTFKYSSTQRFPMDTALFTVYFKVDIDDDYNKTESFITAQINVDGVGQFDVKSNQIKFDRYRESKLASLTVNNHTLSPAFDPNVTTYSVITKDSSVNINASLKNPKATTNISDLSNHKMDLEYGANSFEIVVTAQDKTTRTYKIIVTREDNRNDDSKLQLLNVSGKSIELKDDIYNYTIDVDNSVTKVELLYAPSASTSSVEVIGDEKLEVGENTYTINVTSEKGSTSKYILVVNRLEKEKSNDSSISNIKVTNVENSIKNFKSDNYSYLVTIPSRVKQLELDIELNDSTAKYEILNNEDLIEDSKVVIKVTAEDGSITNYTLLIKIQENNNMLIIIIIILIIFTIIAVSMIIFIKRKKNKINAKEVKKEEVEKNVNDEKNYDE